MDSLLAGIARVDEAGRMAASGTGPPLSLTLMLAFTCLALGLAVGILVLGFFLARDKAKGDEPPTDHSEPKNSG